MHILLKGFLSNFENPKCTVRLLDRIRYVWNKKNIDTFLWKKAPCLELCCLFSQTSRLTEQKKKKKKNPDQNFGQFNPHRHFIRFGQIVGYLW